MLMFIDYFYRQKKSRNIKKFAPKIKKKLSNPVAGVNFKKNVFFTKKNAKNIIKIAIW